jgi:hypothetical protein
LSELPRDPFSNPFGTDVASEALSPFHYSEEETIKRLGDPFLFMEITHVLFSHPRSASYFVLSHGPDFDHDELFEHHHPGEEEGEEEEEGFGPALYSPTNGTKSSGDIYYWGPGIGFITPSVI